MNQSLIKQRAGRRAARKGKEFCGGRRAAFTLVEMLVVLTVIAILAGLLLPALNGAMNRARDTATRDLCVQVADAWKASQLEYRQFPPREVFSWAGDSSSSGNDIVILMNNKAASVLNWWRPRSPVGTTDRTKFVEWIKDRGGEAALFKEYALVRPSAEDLGGKVADLNDRFLERTPEQLQWGVVAPWMKRFLPKTGGTADANLLKEATVKVILDANGDGKVTIPASAGAPYGGETLNLPVAAWVSAGPERNKTITSW